MGQTHNLLDQIPLYCPCAEYKYIDHEMQFASNHKCKKSRKVQCDIQVQTGQEIQCRYVQCSSSDITLVVRIIQMQCISRIYNNIYIYNILQAMDPMDRYCLYNKHSDPQVKLPVQTLLKLVTVTTGTHYNLAQIT